MRDKPRVTSEIVDRIIAKNKGVLQALAEYDRGGTPEFDKNGKYIPPSRRKKK